MAESAASRVSCVMGVCPIPWECNSVGQCYEAGSEDRRERESDDRRREEIEEEQHG